MDFSKMNHLELFKYGMKYSDTPHNAELVDALIATKDVRSIFEAGQRWPDHNYSKKLLDFLLFDKQLFDHLVDMYENKVDSSYTKIELFEELFEHFSHIQVAGFIKSIVDNQSRVDVHNLFKDECLSDDEKSVFLELIDMLIECVKQQSSSYACDIGTYWPYGRFDERVIDSLILTKNPMNLRTSGCRMARRKI